MTKFLALSSVLAVAVFALSACASKEQHYWQRSDPNSALYLTGVKAQQTLEQDIATCVHTIIELTKLSDVRGKVPPSFYALGGYDQMDAEREMSGLPRWDIPEYIYDLRVDHTDFHDFDGCMDFKGWRRVRYVSPEAEFRSQEIYDSTGEYSVRPRNAKYESYDKQMEALHKPR